MDFKITEGPFGRTVEVTKATPTEVKDVLTYLASLDDRVDGVEAPEPRAFVGQVIAQGTRFADYPKGIKLAKYDDSASSWMHVSKDGTCYRWHDYRGPFRPGTGAVEEARVPTITGSLVVQEVWPA